MAPNRLQERDVTRRPGMLTLDLEPNDLFTLLRVRGDLDAIGVGSLRQAARALGRVALLVDLSAVYFVDAAGISALVGVIRRNRERGGVTALVAIGPVAVALCRAGMDQIVRMVETVEEATSLLSSEEAVP